MWLSITSLLFLLILITGKVESPVPVEVGTLAVGAGVDTTVLPPKTILKRTMVVIIIPTWMKCK